MGGVPGWIARPLGSREMQCKEAVLCIRGCGGCAGEAQDSLRGAPKFGCVAVAASRLTKCINVVVVPVLLSSRHPPYLRRIMQSFSCTALQVAIQITWGSTLGKEASKAVQFVDASSAVVVGRTKSRSVEGTLSKKRRHATARVRNNTACVASLRAQSVRLDRAVCERIYASNACAQVARANLNGPKQRVAMMQSGTEHYVSVARARSNVGEVHGLKFLNAPIPPRRNGKQLLVRATWTRPPTVRSWSLQIFPLTAAWPAFYADMRTDYATHALHHQAR